jgi:hypothetical protein
MSNIFILISGHEEKKWMNELVDVVRDLYTNYQVAFIIIGIVIIIVGCVVLALVIYGMIYVCMKYSCCEVTYNVNSPKHIRSLAMNTISDPIPMPPPPPPMPLTKPMIDIERKKKEARHPRPPLAVRYEAARQQVMIVDERGNIPQYTLRSISADGSSGGFTTVMNVDVKPKKYQETEI